LTPHPPLCGSALDGGAAGAACAARARPAQHLPRWSPGGPPHQPPSMGTPPLSCAASRARRGSGATRPLLPLGAAGPSCPPLPQAPQPAGPGGATGGDWRRTVVGGGAASLPLLRCLLCVAPMDPLSPNAVPCPLGGDAAPRWPCRGGGCGVAIGSMQEHQRGKAGMRPSANCCRDAHPHLPAPRYCGRRFRRLFLLGRVPGGEPAAGRAGLRDCLYSSRSGAVAAGHPAETRCRVLCWRPTLPRSPLSGDRNREPTRGPTL